jgi:hypothetical protein
MRLLTRLANRFGYWRLEQIGVGAHCGCCGKWVPNALAVKGWRVTVCDDCNFPKEAFDVQKWSKK